MADLVERFVKDHGLICREEYQELLKRMEEPAAARYVQDEAVRLRKKYYGERVYIRGLVEFTNYFRNG